MTETHTPLPYECFQDRSYYDMWCVRRVNEREWGKGFHLVNGEEAAALRDLLNTRTDSHHRLVEALRALELANDRVCGARPQRVYDAMIAAGMSDALLALDEARRDARAALKEAGR